VTTLAALALLLNLGVFGLHAVAPFRLATAPDPRRRWWAMTALPALLAAVVVTAILVTRRPDEAIAWGLAEPLRGSVPSRWISLCVLALIVVDLLLATGWRRFEAGAWRLVGVFGVLGALAHTLGSEMLRNGSAPLPATLPLFAAAVLRVPLTLAAGELALGPPRLWTPIAGPALWLATRLWTPDMWVGLGAIRWTLLAAALLLLVSRFVPSSLRRATGAAGLVLAALALAQSAEVGRILGGNDMLPDFLLEP